MTYDINELKSECLKLAEMGSDKNEIAGYLIKMGVEFSKVNTMLAKFGLSFKRAANSWDEFTDYFIENDDHSKENLISYLQEECGWDEKKAKKYTSSYYYPMMRLVENLG